MRMLAMGISAIATVLTAAPSRAQTYDPAYPVCLQIYGMEGSYIECGYTSLAQCAQSASRGRVPRQSVFCRRTRPFGGA